MWCLLSLSASLCDILGRQKLLLIINNKKQVNYNTYILWFIDHNNSAHLKSTFQARMKNVRSIFGLYLISYLALTFGFEVDFNSTSSAATCTKTGNFCGNNGLSLDPNNLYKCTTGYAPAIYEDCAFTCVIMTASGKTGADKCSTGTCSSTQYSGSYCGDDQINGDPKNLYYCQQGKPYGAVV